MSKTIERALDEEERAEFVGYAKNGTRLLGKTELAEPAELVAAVNMYVDKHQKSASGFFSKFRSEPPDTVETALALGIVWGNQLVRTLGWEWVHVTTEKANRYAVVAPDRSLIVYATYFVKECLDQPTADCTVLLSYNMLRENKIPEQTAHGYFSVMASVRRIVPKGA